MERKESQLVGKLLTQICHEYGICTKCRCRYVAEGRGMCNRCKELQDLRRQRKGQGK